MTRYTLVLLFAVLVAVAYAVFADGEGGETGPPREMVTITTSAPMSGSEPIPIVVGQKSKFAITLESNRTTGYNWRLAKPLDEGILTNIGSAYNEPGTDLVGSPGTEVWTFKPVGKGTTTIEMEYVRPWEKDAEPAKVQVFKVTVQ